MSANWTPFFQAVTGIGTLLIALVAYLHSRRSFRLQSINLYISNWRELSRIYLQSERASSAFAKLSDKSSSQGGDDVNFLIFMYINQGLLAYYAWKFGALPKDELLAEHRAIWQTIAGHRERAKIFLHSESYPKKFVQLFEKSENEPMMRGGINA
jgi:hypothetical protein